MIEREPPDLGADNIANPAFQRQIVDKEDLRYAQLNVGRLVMRMKKTQNAHQTGRQKCWDSKKKM